MNKAMASAMAVAVAMLAVAAGAAEPVKLFNGKDLDGWTFSGPNQSNVWSVKDGALCDAGKPAGYIRTTKDYTSFVLKLQMRHLTEGNSGVLLRVQEPDKVWPRSIECQGMRNNMGDIFNIDKFPMTTDPARTKGRHTPKLHPSNEKPLGEWNDYELELNKGNLTIKVNGVVQNTATECAELPGKIALQSEGAKVEFRNIELTPIE